MDRVTVAELQAYLSTHWENVIDELLVGTYRPKSVRRLEISKPGGGVRLLGIPTVMDRFLQQAQRYIQSGLRWGVDMDLEKFFDRANHDILMARVARKVTDKRVLKLIRACFEAGMMEGGVCQKTDEGTPQGGPLSPLLANILLDELDKELTKRGGLCAMRMMATSL